MAPSSQSLVGGTQASGTVTPTSALKPSDTSQAPPIISVSTASGSTRPARRAVVGSLSLEAYLAVTQPVRALSLKVKQALILPQGSFSKQFPKRGRASLSKGSL